MSRLSGRESYKRRVVPSFCYFGVPNRRRVTIVLSSCLGHPFSPQFLQIGLLFSRSDSDLTTFPRSVLLFSLFTTPFFLAVLISEQFTLSPTPSKVFYVHRVILTSLGSKPLVYRLSPPTCLSTDHLHVCYRRGTHVFETEKY